MTLVYFQLKKAVGLYMYTNSAPMGDCRAVHRVEQMDTSPAETLVVEGEEAPAMEVEKAKPKQWFRPWSRRFVSILRVKITNFSYCPAFCLG